MTELEGHAYRRHAQGSRDSGSAGPATTAAFGLVAIARSASLGTCPRYR